jgi:hypothetical protein
MATATSSHGAEEVVAEARRSGRTRSRGARRRRGPTWLGQRLADRHAVLGHGDVELVDVDVVAELAGGAAGEAERPAGAGEDDVGSLVERDAGHAERQRGVRQHAGDHDLLAVEQTHAGRR